MPKIDFARAVTAEDKARAARAALVERIRQRREVAVQAGIVVAGVAVATDNVSQNRILAVARAVQRNPARVINWKTAEGGFRRLTAAQVTMVADAVLDHIQDCFNHEEALLAEVEGGRVPDIETGWP